MIGQYVNKGALDTQSAQAVVQFRNAVANVEILINWLALNPVVDGVDPLVTNTTDFGYSSDDAAKLRAYFAGIDTMLTTNADAINAGRALTGVY